MKCPYHDEFAFRHAPPGTAFAGDKGCTCEPNAEHRDALREYRGILTYLGRRIVDDN